VEHTQHPITAVNSPHTMKFSFQVETDSSLYEAPPTAPHKSRGLTWDIEVVVDQVRLPAQVEKQVVEKIEQVVRKADTASKVTSVKPPEIPRKESYTETSTGQYKQETRKVSNRMNSRGRKVSRQGEWLVFTERVGVLTTQNGVQQIREERVRINSDDLADLIAMGF